MKYKILLLMMFVLAFSSAFYTENSKAFGSGTPIGSYQCFFHEEPYHVVLGAQPCPPHPNEVQLEKDKAHREGDPECYRRLPTV